MRSSERFVGLAGNCLGHSYRSLATPFFTVLAGHLSDVFSFEGLSSALWPNLLGGLLALGLGRWKRFVPAVPPGDLIVAGERIARASAVSGMAVERADGLLRRWPVARISLLLAALILAALASGH